MRVITGSARGCRLETLAGQETRPTAERVKEGLFSAIQFDIEGRRALDLFAGSGQLGVEALSRGAASCVFVDCNPEAVAVIRRNLQTAHLAAQARVVAVDALSFLSRPGERFDLAFLDPPYGAELLTAALEGLVPHMQPGGVILCEGDEGQMPPETVGAFRRMREYRYGRVRVWLYRWTQTDNLDGRGESP